MRKMALNKGAIGAFAIFLILKLATAESLPVLEEGDACSASAPCPKHSGLNCQYGFCRCPITWSYEDGECKIQAGQRCDKSDNDKSGSCVNNSECISWKNECICKTGYIPSLNGTCSKEKNYGDSCSFDEDCTTKNKTFHCIDGMCQCDVKVSQYRISRRNTYREDQGEGCVGLTKSPCIFELCVENAECSRRNEKICECRYNYKATAENTCVGVAGANCPCAEGFICVDNTCRCALSNLQYYDQEKMTCSSYVGSPCNDDTLRCIGTAECVKRAGKMGICECPKGSVETPGGKCDLSYGSSCNSISVTGSGTQCDVMAFLHCKNGTCNCVDGSIYEENTRRCAMPVGFRCDEKESSKVYCVANAECVKAHPKLSGRCQCRDGFVKTSENTCEETIEYLIGDNEL